MVFVYILSDQTFRDVVRQTTRFLVISTFFQFEFSSNSSIRDLKYGASLRYGANLKCGANLEYGAYLKCGVNLKYGTPLNYGTLS